MMYIEKNKAVKGDKKLEENYNFKDDGRGSGFICNMQSE